MPDKKSIPESNIITFVRQCMNTFEEVEFSEVDSLVLSAFSYLKFPDFLENVHYPEGIPIRELYKSEYFDSMFSSIYQSELYMDLFFAMAASPRYRDLMLSDYVNILDQESHMQFAAITIGIQSGLSYVSFRGTDSSFTGWKEDLNMSRNKPIPGQLEALNYLEQLLYYNHNTILTGGHSKGGNLAVYASANLIQKYPVLESQFQRIYSHDGPGFSERLTNYIDFDRICQKIHKTVPQSSMIGLVMYQEADFQIIESSGRGGIEQHSPFTWIIEDNHFKYLDSLTDLSILFRQTINKWNQQLDDSERDKLIEILFRLFDCTEVDNFNDFSTDMQHQISLIFNEIRELDPETRSFFLSQLKDLAQTGIKTVPVILQDKSDNYPGSNKKIKQLHIRKIHKK